MPRHLTLLKIILIFALIAPAGWAANQAQPQLFAKSLTSQSFVWSDDTDKLSGQHKYLLAKKYQQDPHKQKLALQYLKDSADKGYAEAQYDLGMKFYKGDKLSQNLSMAGKWLAKAASQDHIKAQFQMGLLYQNGDGVKRNHSKAVKYLQKAADNGHGVAQHALAIIYLTSEEDKNIRQAHFWLQKSVQQKNSDAQRDLGFLYYQGLGTNKDYKQAVALLHEPATQGNPMSQYLLGEIYAQGGYGIGQQRNKSLNWYKQALRSGYSDAQVAINKLQNKSKTHSGGNGRGKSRSFVVSQKTHSKQSDFNVKQLYQWKNAWEQKDIKSYLDFYSKNFKGKTGDYKDWAKYRRKVIGKSDNIRIKLGNVKTEIKNSQNILVSFNQHYQSNSYSDKVRKRQYWQKEGDSNWRIVREYSN